MTNVRLIQKTMLAIEDQPDLLRSDQWATRGPAGITYDFATWAITIAHPQAEFVFDRTIDDDGPAEAADKVILRPGGDPAWIHAIAIDLLDLDPEHTAMLLADENRASDLTRVVESILEAADDTDIQDVTA